MHDLYFKLNLISQDASSRFKKRHKRHISKKPKSDSKKGKLFIKASIKNQINQEKIITSDLKTKERFASKYKITFEFQGTSVDVR